MSRARDPEAEGAPGATPEAGGGARTLTLDPRGQAAPAATLTLEPALAPAPARGEPAAPAAAAPASPADAVTATVAAATAVATPAGPPLKSARAEAPVVDPAHYQFLGEVARGGIGRVLRARDLRLGREVAIKELLGGAERARFRREAELTARLQHPAIVPVYEAGRWPSGEPFYAMKLVAGAPLAARLDAANTLSERLALLPHLIAVADAIAYAHGQGVIHRDLKPSNILIGDFGETVVIDWGLAKHVSEPDLPQQAGPSQAPDATVAGAVLGTPPYMSPEQARGEPARESSDVYALGAILYHLLARRAPYEGPSAADVLADVVAEPPPALEEVAPDAPADLCAVVNKAMARDAAARYPSARELSADLRRFQTGGLVSAHRYGTLARVRRWVARHQRVVQVATVLVLALLVVGVLGLRGVLRERARAERRSIEAQAQRQAVHLMRARAVLAEDPTRALVELGASGAARWEPRSVQEIGALAIDAGTARARLATPGADVAALSPDGRHLALGTSEGLVRIAALGRAPRVLATFAAHTGHTRALRWLDDGRLASGGDDGAVRVWSTAGNRLAQLTQQDRVVTRLVLSPDRRLLAAGGGAHQPEVIVLEAALAGRGGVRVLEGNQAWVSDLAFSPDGRVVAAGADDGAVWLWDVATGAGHRLGHHATNIERLAFSPDGHWLATGGDDQTARLWPLPAGEPRTLGGHGDWVNWVLWLPNNQLITAAGDGSLRRWNPAGGDPLLLRGHIGTIWDVALAPDGHTLASAGKDRTLRLWDLERGAALATLRGHTGQVKGVAFTPAGEPVSVDLDGELRVWDHGGGHREWPAHDGLVSAVASAHGRIVSAGRDGRVRAWDGATPGALLHQHAAWVVSLALSQDGRVLASADNTGVLLVSTAPGAAPRELHPGGIPAPLALSSDGRWLVGGGMKPFVLDTGTGSLTQLPPSDTEINRVLVAPAGDRAVLSARGRVQLVTLASGAIEQLPSVGVARALAWTRDGRLAIAAEALSIWEAGKLRQLDASARGVSELSLSSDGRELVGVGGEHAMAWPLSGGPGRELATPSGHDPNPSDQGDYLVTYDQDGRVRVQRARDGALAVHAVAPGGFPVVVVDPHQHTLVVGDLDGRVHVLALDDAAFVPGAPDALLRWLPRR